jgi:hypothetical protein
MASITISKSSDAILSDLRRGYRYVRTYMYFSSPSSTTFLSPSKKQIQDIYQLSLILGLFLHPIDLN